ncbi:MAG: sensor histidine kinase [Sedimentisphaerales bacterium]
MGVLRLLSPALIPEKPATRIQWFIRLRWLAASGVLVFTIVGRFLLQLQFEVAPLIFVCICIALYNTVFFILAYRTQPEGKWGEKFSFIQVGTDILALTILMHFGGGIENPFISYYLFHTIIAAILLPWWKVALQVLLASSCIAGLAIAELVGLLTHRHVRGLLPFELYDNFKFVMVTVLAIITTLCISALLAASISQRLHEREEQLSAANEDLKEQDRIKSQYVMRVAHDLGGPAGTITSCLKLVTLGLTGPIPEKALDMVQRAQRKSEYLGHLIRDLLSLSRIKAAKEIPKTAVELPKIINQVFEALQPQVTDKSLVLEQKLPAALPAVYGNAEAIYELFDNLVTNAVKYTPIGGRVELAVSNTGDKVLVKIQDNGVGIPAEAVPHIFEEFYRADNVKAEGMEGTGLGLAIVKQILHAHEAKFWVESEQGSGTTFSFTLPIMRKSYV